MRAAAIARYVRHCIRADAPLSSSAAPPPSGPISARPAHLATGAAVDLHPPGPGMSEYGADSFTYVTVGPWLSFVDPRSGPEGIYLLTGRQTKVFTPTSFTWRFDGRVDDLCTRLAAATPR